MLVDKPWGHYKQFALNRNCSVRLIVIEPGQETSLHWHNLRSDLWIILDDGIKVQLGDEYHDAKPGEEFFIPSEQLHRLISKGEKARVLEIAFGYCIEDDIHRLDDDYGRPIDE